MNEMSLTETTYVSREYGVDIKFHSKSSKIVSPWTLFNHFFELNDHVYKLQETIDKLDYIMDQHTNMLDGIAHIQAIIENHLTGL